MSAVQEARPVEQANRLVDHDEFPPSAELMGDAALPMAWALKDLCYASWSSEPQRAVRAAEALRRLRGAARAGFDSGPSTEIDALVAWTDGIACLIRGEMDVATARFDAAAALFRGLGQPRHAAQTQVPKIMALTMLGRHDDAARCAEAAQLALLVNGDLHAASKVSLNLGNLYLRSDRYAAAAERFREAAVLFARSGDHELSVMADNGLADALTAIGDFSEAQRIYARARWRASTHGFPVLEAVVEESVALLDLARGCYRDALAGLEGARRRYAALQMPQHLAIAEKQLADAYLELRLLPESLAGFDAALEQFRALDMQVDRAWTLVQRGRAQALSGNHAATAASLSEAAALFATQDNIIGAAAVALARAELRLAHGDGGQALELARKAEDGFGRAGLVERQLRAQSVRAQALLKSGEIEAARALFDRTLAAACGYQLLPVQLRCLTGRAMAARAAGDRTAARVDLDAAVELFEDQRRTLPGDEIRSAFQSDHLAPFSESLRMALDAHESGEAGAADVLAQLDRFRARTLADRMGNAPTEGGNDALQAATRDLRTRLAWLYRRLQRLQDEADASPQLSAEIRTTERELLERARRIRLSSGATAAVRRIAQFDASALQRRLEPGDALVEYGVLDDELFACVVTSTDLQVQRRMASWRQVQDAVRSMRFQLEALRHGSAPIKHHLPTLTLRARSRLKHLHDLVWQPLETLLAGRQRVLIVPHGQLGTVPFAALHDGECCLAERYQLALAPSARVALHSLARRLPAAQTVLALGESARLPQAAHEARAVAALLPHGIALVGERATAGNLRAHCAGADVVHFACHAQFRADNPLFSALYLHDGVLAAEAIESIPLPGAIVVLSACETVLHDEGAGDEMVGLTRAFLLAGAARVMASFWSVDDATTAELMVDFYVGLRSGEPPAAALRMAQLAAKQRHEHPFHWSSFTLVGGW